jgi:hypothetical protein
LDLEGRVGTPEIVNQTLELHLTVKILHGRISQEERPARETSIGCAL